MNDETPDPLAEELAALRPHELSPAFRRRVAESLAGPRPVTSRWPWVVALAGGLAAAVLAVAILGRGGDPGVVTTRAIVEPRPGPAVQAEDAMPTLQAYRQALARSPEELDALLDKHAARAPGPDPRLVRIHASTPSDRELQALTGDL
jgi:hypothetical protein